ncbi:hypothetical protein [Microbulbifer sp. 2205BS26-8]|uniref:hypothetical protein n=1 Tax=Microbulbifer sp. 2205BS26-8 TaxID=3064386 RepID=UPI00273ECF15|nr:hypothetical protein [Microbulbifer sp. 2205BS26-8]MDP5208848.1 hypothetical protein [Microbulbifer sp. 2205BS26-8]
MSFIFFSAVKPVALTVRLSLWPIGQGTGPFGVAAVWLGKWCRKVFVMPIDTCHAAARASSPRSRQVMSAQQRTVIDEKSSQCLCTGCW